jgi:nucleoside-diphosphate-sugar epimerase
MSKRETFLVTGALGCLGAWTLYHLLHEDRRVVSFDQSEDRHRLNLLLTPDEQAQITFVTGDLRDPAAVFDVFQTHGITQVIHLAALQVPFCRANPVLGAQVNVVGTINVFDAARAAGVGHVVYASSVAVYGPPDAYPPGPVRDDALPAPRTNYGVYKVANEQQARVYWHDHRISSLALRPYTVYGVGRDQGLTSDPTKAMLAAAAGQPFAIGFGGTMQFQWASDVARQFIACALHPLDGAYAFNLSTASTSVTHLLDIIREIVPGSTVTCGDTQLPFPTAFDGQALPRSGLPVYETPLHEGVRRTIDHFRTCLSDGRLAL